VVIDVKSGAILALASFPTYNPTILNPDTFEEDSNLIVSLTTDPRQPLFNKATQGQYFPGSTFKIVTTVAAANEGIIGRDEVFYCDLEWPGGELYGDVLAVRPDWRKTDGLPPAGDVTIAQALTASCDPFFYEMGARLFQKDPDLLVEYAQLLGLGSEVGLPLEEAQGNLAPPRGIGDAINNAVGQGEVQIPPIQMAQMAAAIANGGTLYRAYLVERVGGADGAELSFQAQPEVIRTLDLKPGVIDIVKAGMCAVPIDENLGTAYRVFRTAPYTSCGKMAGPNPASIPTPGTWPLLRRRTPKLPSSSCRKPGEGEVPRDCAPHPRLFRRRKNPSRMVERRGVYPLDPRRRTGGG
jgi:penicillin-binding protein 2